MLNTLVLYMQNCFWNENTSNNKSNKKLPKKYQHDRNSLLCYFICLLDPVFNYSIFLLVYLRAE